MDAAPLWIFAYGSLMWRPDFPFAERHRAVLHGYHRALCIWSHHYRGSVERPGLVFGLDAGGGCVGVAFRVHPEAAAPTLEAVRRRELITRVYREIEVPVALDDGRSVAAVAYAADVAHAQYAGRLAIDDLIGIVSGAAGETGSNRDYVLQTQAHLLDLGVDDPALAALCAGLEEADTPQARPLGARP